MAYQRNLLANLSTKGKIALAASVVGVVVVAILLVNFASRPSYSTLMSGLDPAQTGKITKALDARGIGYEIQNNGTALAVDATQVPQARIALAEAGLGGTGGSSHASFDLVTKQKLGASTFQQQVAYQQALQGELATTIEQIDGVSSAKVNLVIPQEQLFAEEAQQATANILITGSSLDASAVRGIAQLVSSSVKGLKVSDVSITDGSGQLLWPNGEAGGSGAAGKQAAEARYDQMLEGQLDAMLTATAGAGKASAQVNSDLNVDATTKDALTYAKRGVPIQTKSEQETLTGGGGAGGGAAGAGANIPGFAAGGAGGGGTTDYQRRTTDTEYAVDKIVTRTKVAPGAINKLDVALLVDKSVPAATVTALKTAVTNAAGIDTARGDRISVSQVAFAKPAAPAEPPAFNPIAIGKYVLMGLAALLFLFFVSRLLKRREEDVLASGEPTWLREIEAPRPIAAFAAGGEAPTEQVELNSQGRTMRRKLESIVDQEPERVAAQVKTWMSEQ